MRPAPRVVTASVGALAAANADTWATEMGAFSPALPAHSDAGAAPPRTEAQAAQGELPRQCPAILWWRGAARWSLATLWHGYREALNRRRDLSPAHTGIRGTWLETETWLAHLDTVLAA